MHDYVSTVLYWPYKEPAGTKGVVDDHWDTSLMCNLGNSREVWYVVPRIPNAFNIDRFSLVIDGFSYVFSSIPVDERGLDAKTREENLELVVCALILVVSTSPSRSDFPASICPLV